MERKNLGKKILGAGAVFGLGLLLVVGTGCPQPPPVTNACSGNPCDDGDPCTIDTCTVDAAAEEGYTCAYEDVVCEGDLVCDPTTGECVEAPAECFLDADCDDDNVCTDDTCNDEGVCEYVNNTAECDDDDLCTEDDVCADGVCAGTAIVCDTGFECDPATGDCVEIPAECTTNGDCDDDGLFCTGDPVCEDGVCGFSGNPCAEGEECDEEANTCGVVEETFALTAPAETAEGDSGTTDFDFTLSRAGGDGDAKTLDWAVSSAGGVGTAAVDDFVGGAFPTGTVDFAADDFEDKTITIEVAGDTSVEDDEVFTVTVSEAGTDVATVDGTITNDDSTADPVVTLPTDAGATVGQNSLIQGVSVADADNTTCTVGIVTGDGFLSFNAAPACTAVDGNGNAVTLADVLKSEYVLTGTITNINTTLAGFQFTTDRSSSNPGTDQVTFTATDADGGEGTGTLDIAVGIRIDLTAASDTGTSFTGTAGGDVFRATTPAFFGQGDVLVGGDGPDMIEIQAAAAATYPAADVAAFSCTSIETLWISSTAGGPVVFDNFTDIPALDTITYWPSGAHALTIDDAPDEVVVNVRTDNGAFAAAVDVDIRNATFGAQSFTVNMLGDSTNGVDITTLNNGNADVETVYLHSGSRNGTTVTGNTLSTGAGANIALTTLYITGDQNLNIGTWAAGDAAAIDASDLTGNLTVTAYAQVSGSLLGGGGNDVLVGAAAAQALNGGAGTDTMTGGAGADQYTCGAGNDTLIQTANDAIDTVTDFDAGTATTSADTITFSLAAIEARAGIIDLVSASLTTLVATDAITYTALGTDGATPGDFDIIGIIGDYADAAAALAAKTSWTITYGAAATADDAILIAYTSGTSVRIAVAVNTATATSDGIDGVIDLLILQNTTLSNLDSSDFNALGA